jgi:UDP-N-acetylmuramoylalanine--D-glutamate ligase
MPLIDRLDQVDAQDWLVLELSSFQLELFDGAEADQSLSPAIGAILNITPNHLDRHPSMAHYAACKANILRWQGSEDVAMLGAEDAFTGAWLRTGQMHIDAGPGQSQRCFPIAAKRLGFGLTEPAGDGCWLSEGWIVLCQAGRCRPVVAASAVGLRGRHNLLNLAAACAIADAAGATVEAMAEVARSFGGVAHRLEPVRILNGVSWVNDSIATTPERAVAALRSFDEPIVLLAGGRDKKLSWEEFARLVHERVKALILFGEAAPLIAEAVARSPASGQLRVDSCHDLEEAVATAYHLATPGDVVLLSPGGTSFDAYRDFEERGRHFRRLVGQLPGETAREADAGTTRQDGVGLT